MGSIAERVCAVIASDGVVQEALRRGIVNRRALARWMIDREGWDASEEAVTSALRRTVDELDASVREESDPLLADLEVTTRAQVCLASYRKGPGIGRRLEELFDRIPVENGTTLRMHLAEGTVTVAVGEGDRETVREVLAPLGTVCPFKSATEIHLSFPTASEDTTGAVATVVDELANRRIELVGIAHGSSECSVFVAEEDGLEAFEAVNRLVENAR